MIVLNRILIPTDFSDLAIHALRYACDFARTYRTELHVLHIVSATEEVPVAIDGGSGVGPIGSSGGVTLMEPIQDVLARKSQELRAHLAEFNPDHLPVEPIAVVRSGVPWKEIVRYSEEAAIDLIVIGSHARGVMNRILLGSTSKAVVEHIARPVLMVPIAAMRDVNKIASSCTQVGTTD